MTVDALVGVAFEPDHLHRPWSSDLPAGDVAGRADRRLFTIRAADSEGHRSSAHILVNRMYAWRGYSGSALAETNPQNRITLIATDLDVTIGTITVGFNEGSDRLLVEELFRDHVVELQNSGTVVCEFIKLAIDGVVRSKRVLASLFHTAFIYAREIKGCHKILIEVNPRHVRFYSSMLGFSVLTQPRLNHRVNAPAVLMSLDLAYAELQIDAMHRDELRRIRPGRSLYPHCFTHDEIAGIVGRLRRKQ